MRQSDVVWTGEGWRPLVEDVASRRWRFRMFGSREVALCAQVLAKCSSHDLRDAHALFRRLLSG